MMGLKYTQFAVNVPVQDLFKSLVNLDYMEDYTRLMNEYSQFRSELGQEFDKMKDAIREGQMTEEESHEKWMEIFENEPEDEDLREFHRKVESDDIHRFDIWFRSVPDDDNWTFGGFTRRSGWIHAFEPQWEIVLTGVLYEAGVDTVYIINYHHNEDAGSVRVISNLQGDKGEMNVETYSSNKSELFEFAELFSERVESECGLPLRNIHEYLKNNFDVEWDYQVGSEELIKNDEEE